MSRFTTCKIYPVYPMDYPGENGNGDWVKRSGSYSRHGIEGVIDNRGNVISGQKSKYNCKEFRLKKVMSGE